MSSQPNEHDLEIAIKLEERAHRLRMAMLRDDELMAGALQGYEAARRGDVIPPEELDRELGYNE